MRDTHCRAPGCNRLAKGCELDHTVPWSEGGETNVGNLAHLCPKHHHLKHETNWSLKPGSDGALHWISPSGQVFTTEPDPPDWYPLEPLPDT
ncbi:HNH endonuclease signature motif containing protein [Plantibacter sp. YIM 135347]|uniref:HNH endonuclease signature motif containing protein n=1 Tax=Plantibacter sp. YIM 135347 TaxID=3423919 RepID=UPI003D326A78